MDEYALFEAVLREQLRVLQDLPLVDQADILGGSTGLISAAQLLGKNTFFKVADCLPWGFSDGDLEDLGIVRFLDFNREWLGGMEVWGARVAIMMGTLGRVVSKWSMTLH